MANDPSVAPDDVGPPTYSSASFFISSQPDCGGSTSISFHEAVLRRVAVGATCPKHGGSFVFRFRRDGLIDVLAGQTSLPPDVPQSSGDCTVGMGYSLNGTVSIGQIEEAISKILQPCDPATNR